MPGAGRDAVSREHRTLARGPSPGTARNLRYVNWPQRVPALAKVRRSRRRVRSCCPCRPTRASLRARLRPAHGLRAEVASRFGRASAARAERLPGAAIEAYSA